MIVPNNTITKNIKKKGFGNMKNKIEEKINKFFSGKISIKIENGDVSFMEASGTKYGIQLILASLASSLKEYMNKEEILFAINLGLNTDKESLKKEKVSNEKLNKLINKLFE